MIISKFFSFSKKNEYVEIPIEVMEVSEQTAFKKPEPKAKPKPKPKKNIEEAFKAPKVVQKPKIPDFVEKKDVKKEKKKIKDDNRLNSILKSIDEIKKSKSQKIENVEKNIDEEISRFDEKLTISELDMIRRQFISCWNIPAGAKNIESLQVLVKISLDKEGNVINSKLINTKNLDNPFYRAASESALRAVRHPACKKLKVPEKKYKIWKNITLNFDPSMISR